MLVPIDFSDVSPVVVQTAGDWAAAAGFRVELFHVRPEEADLIGYESGLQLVTPPEPFDPSREQARMEVFERELAQRGIEVTARVVQGSPVLDILEEAAAVGATVIVMGSHRHGTLHHLLLGSVSGGVLRRAVCPLLLVPTPSLERAGAGGAETTASEA
jgi:nucleotide-binding universal stress UspA family protein